MHFHLNFLAPKAYICGPKLNSGAEYLFVLPPGPVHAWSVLCQTYFQFTHVMCDISYVLTLNRSLHQIILQCDLGSTVIKFDDQM